MKSQNYYQIVYRQPRSDEFCFSGFNSRKAAVGFSAQILMSRAVIQSIKLNGQPLPPNEVSNLLLAANLWGRGGMPAMNSEVSATAAA